MDIEKEKAIAFYTVLIFGLGVIVTVDVSNRITTFAMFVQGILFVGVMYIAVKTPLIYKTIKSWQKSTKPKLNHWFKLQGENKLLVYIENPKNAKDIHVECAYCDYKDIRGRNYLNEYRHELKLATDLQSNDKRVFSDVLRPNDTRVIDLSISHNGKIALRMGDHYVFGFRDGRYEYKISCFGNYLNVPYRLTDFSIWLTIKDGVLVKINEDL
jgi:hypothetical protein